MKKMYLALCLFAITMLLQSCYITRSYEGAMTSKEPRVEVGSRRNHFLLGGLIPLGRTAQAQDFVGDNEDYMVQTKHTFVNGLVTWLTGYLYSPSTTSFHLPKEKAISGYKNPTKTAGGEHEFYNNQAPSQTRQRVKDAPKAGKKEQPKATQPKAPKKQRPSFDPKAI